MSLKSQILFKVYYLVLDAKLLLFNMNHVEMFFIESLTKNLTKLFTPVDVIE